jgi:riboflavin synthase
MFTGIVRHIGRVVSLTPTPAGQRIVLDPCGWSHHPQPGDSIACSGCCLTLVQPLTASGGLFTFDAIPETLSKTTLGTWTPGRRVNLEAAARVGDRLDGHIVQGHVDATATVDRVDTTNGWRTRIRVPPDLGRYLIPKGSIAVDGVSLTLAAVSPPGDPNPLVRGRPHPRNPRTDHAPRPSAMRVPTPASSRPGEHRVRWVGLREHTVKTIVQVVEHYLRAER